MKFKAEKFLPETEIKKRSADWKKQARGKELGPGFHSYVVTRVEGKNYNRDLVQSGFSIESAHHISFIEIVIPELIAQKKPGEKVKILDVGAGVGAYAEQIRRMFSDKVEVYSTGLSKKAAIGYRKHQKETYDLSPIESDLNPPLSSKLHPNELKWRSVKELSDFEEFDLIIDTYGEAFYSKKIYGHASEKLTQERMLEFSTYLSIVVKKLKPGGIISIAPCSIKDFIDTTEELGKKLGVKIHFIGGDVCRITKPLNNKKNVDILETSNVDK
jgi:hypothetical protein